MLRVMKTICILLCVQHLFLTGINSNCVEHEQRIKKLENHIKQLWKLIGNYQKSSSESLQYIESFSETPRSKRLLLTDHDIVQSLQTKDQELLTKLQELQTKVQTIENSISLKINGLEAKVQTILGGAIFVHWGKQRCPDNDTELVYSGYLGGSEYKTPGATVTTVCLSPDPIFGSRNPVHLSNNMHGSEIDTDFFGPGTGTQDNTCAVCKSRLHTTSVMIPGRNECYQGWKKQYSGYLMSSPVGNYSPKDSICLNEHPEFVVGGGVNSNGNLLYPIKAVCGSLECPPYVDGKLITCVVCTQ